VAGFVEDLRQYHYLDRLLLVVILVDAKCIIPSEKSASTQLPADPRARQDSLMNTNEVLTSSPTMHTSDAHPSNQSRNNNITATQHTDITIVVLYERKQK
jgi:hypothetical protein